MTNIGPQERLTVPVRIQRVQRDKVSEHPVIFTGFQKPGVALVEGGPIVPARVLTATFITVAVFERVFSDHTLLQALDQLLLKTEKPEKSLRELAYGHTAFLTSHDLGGGVVRDHFVSLWQNNDLQQQTMENALMALDKDFSRVNILIWFKVFGVDLSFLPMNLLVQARVKALIRFIQPSLIKQIIVDLGQGIVAKGVDDSEIVLLPVSQLGDYLEANSLV